MKKWVAIFVLVIIFISACAPSQDAVQTAIAQTQIAMPTSTATFSPTSTPTPTITPSPSPTPDLRVITTDPKEFLMSTTDLPSEAKYYLPNSNWISPHRNNEIIQAMGAEAGEKYINETGRVDGWFVSYRRGSGKGLYPEEVYDNVIMYQSAEGAQLFVTKYTDSLKDPGYEKAQDAPLVGDVTRVYVRKEGERVWYLLVFSYRNYVHRIIGYGLESEVKPEFIESIARKLLANLESASLSTP